MSNKEIRDIIKILNSMVHGYNDMIYDYDIPTQTQENYLSEIRSELSIFNSTQSAWHGTLIDANKHGKKVINWR